MSGAGDTSRKGAPERPSARSGDVLASPALRRLQLAWVGSILGGWAYLVALGVYAYGEGGAAAVGLVGLIRLCPRRIAAPFTASLADRFPRVGVMVASDLVRCALMLGAPRRRSRRTARRRSSTGSSRSSTISGTVFRPAQAALLPALVRSPSELTAANVASSTIESVGTFLGPALGGLLLAVSSPEVVFAANGATLPLVGVPRPRAPALRAAARATRAIAARAQAPASSSGIRTIAAEPTLRTLVGLYAAQTLVAGALNVLVVVTSFELLELDEAGVGLLYAAVGVGGLVGGFVALLLSPGGRLARDFALGLALFGLPLALIGGLPVAAVAVAGSPSSGSATRSST